jgi:transposase-like protein
MKTRRKFTPEFKAKVSLEALKERDSITELAKRFELHPNQVNTWKKEFLANSAKVFSASSIVPPKIRTAV